VREVVGGFVNRRPIEDLVCMNCYQVRVESKGSNIILVPEVILGYCIYKSSQADGLGCSPLRLMVMDFNGYRVRLIIKKQ
jgi:hypothetical protein